MIIRKKTLQEIKARHGVRLSFFFHKGHFYCYYKTSYFVDKFGFSGYLTRGQWMSPQVMYNKKVIGRFKNHQEPKWRLHKRITRHFGVFSGHGWRTTIMNASYCSTVYIWLHVIRLLINTNNSLQRGTRTRKVKQTGRSKNKSWSIKIKIRSFY